MIKEKEFVEIDYTGYDQEGNVFDTTRKEDELNPDPNKNYKPITICLGEGHILEGLDKKLIGKEIGKHDIKLKPEEAFGKKDPKNLKLMPMKAFKGQGVQPYSGLQLTIDNKPGTVRSVSGGRVIMDFNHPLSGQIVEYNVNIKRKVEDKKEQVQSVLALAGVKYKEVNAEEDKATVKLEQDIPEQYNKLLAEEVERLTSLKVVFSK